jgi:hypothetical protein
LLKNEKTRGKKEKIKSKKIIFFIFKFLDFFFLNILEKLLKESNTYSLFCTQILNNILVIYFSLLTSNYLSSQLSSFSHISSNFKVVSFFLGEI